MLVVGIGLGLIASQLTNVNLASAGADKTSEVGALQGTSQNLGSALGTAVIGSLLLGLLTTTFDHRVEGDEALPYGPRHEVAAKTEHGLAFIPAEAAGATLRQQGVPAQVVTQLEADYSQSQIDALKIAVAGVAAIALLGLGATRRLPANPLRGAARRGDARLAALGSGAEGDAFEGGGALFLSRAPCRPLPTMVARSLSCSNSRFWRPAARAERSRRAG